MWRGYVHITATTGLSANKNIEIVPYDEERMMDIAKGFYYRFGDRNPKPEEFKVFDKRDRHPGWFKKAKPVVKRVHDVWARVGLKFPWNEVMEGW